MLTIERTKDFQTLIQQADLWNGLAGGVPFRETSWLGSWWKHVADDACEPFVLMAKDQQGNIVGILPLYEKLPRVGGSKVLGIMGDGEVCSDYLSILVSPDDAVEVATAMADFLLMHSQTEGLRWDEIELDGIIEDDLPMMTFIEVLKEQGATMHSCSRLSTWFKASEDSWDAHLKTMSKSRRRKTKRLCESVTTNDRLDLVFPSDQQEVQERLTAMIALHQKRWNEAGRPGSFASECVRGFIMDAALDFFARGLLYLPAITLYGEPIGSEFNLIGGNKRLYSYSVGVDTDKYDYQPGNLLQWLDFQYIYRNEMEGMDMMRGDEEYKKRMQAVSKRIFEIRIAAPRLMPRIRQAVWSTGFCMKQWVRESVGRAPIEVVDFPCASQFQL